MKVTNEELDLVLSTLATFKGSIDVEDVQKKCPLDASKIQAALARFETDGLIQNIHEIEESDDYSIILLKPKGKSFAYTQSYQDNQAPVDINELTNKVLRFITRPENEGQHFHEKQLSDMLGIDIYYFKAITSKLKESGLVELSKSSNPVGYCNYHVLPKAYAFSLDGGFRRQSEPSTVVHNDNSIHIGKDFSGVLTQGVTVGRDFMPTTKPPTNPTTAEPSKPNKTLLGKLIETISNNIIPTILGIIGAVIAGFILWKLGWI